MFSNQQSAISNQQSAISNQQSRLANFELLRIVAMVMITMHHLLIHSAINLQPNIDVYVQENPFLAYILSAINLFILIGVNLFFLVSGYFTIKLKIQKLINILINLVFISLILFLINIIIYRRQINFSLVIEYLNCIRSYWYITVYILLSMVSPFLNKIVEFFDKKSWTLFFILYLIIGCCWFFVIRDSSTGLNNGYSLCSACCLYLIGGGLHKFNVKLKKPGLLLFISYVLNVLLLLIPIFILKSGKYTWAFFAYNNIFIVLQSVFFFLLFAKLKVNEKAVKIINFIVPAVLTIYIVQSNPFRPEGRDFLINYLYQKFSYLVAVLGLLPNAIAVFLIILFFYKIYHFLFSKMTNILSCKLAEIINSLLILLTKLISKLSIKQEN